MLDAMIDDLGDVPDAEYLADPRLDEVIRLARIALVTMIGKTPRRCPGRSVKPMTKVEFPSVRDEVRGALGSLADRDHQQE